MEMRSKGNHGKFFPLFCRFWVCGLGGRRSSAQLNREDTYRFLVFVSRGGPRLRCRPLSASLSVRGGHWGVCVCCFAVGQSEVLASVENGPFLSVTQFHQPLFVGVKCTVLDHIHSQILAKTVDCMDGWMYVLDQMSLARARAAGRSCRVQLAYLHVVK